MLPSQNKKLLLTFLLFYASILTYKHLQEILVQTYSHFYAKYSVSLQNSYSEVSLLPFFFLYADASDITFNGISNRLQHLKRFAPVKTEEQTFDSIKNDAPLLPLWKYPSQTLNQDEMAIEELLIPLSASKQPTEEANSLLETATNPVGFSSNYGGGYNGIGTTPLRPYDYASDPFTWKQPTYWLPPPWNPTVPDYSAPYIGRYHLTSPVPVDAATGRPLYGTDQVVYSYRPNEEQLRRRQKETLNAKTSQILSTIAAILTGVGNINLYPFLSALQLSANGQGQADADGNSNVLSENVGNFIEHFEEKFDTEPVWSTILKKLSDAAPQKLENLLLALSNSNRTQAEIAESQKLVKNLIDNLINHLKKDQRESSSLKNLLNILSYDVLSGIIELLCSASKEDWDNFKSFVSNSATTSLFNDRDSSQTLPAKRNTIVEMNELLPNTMASLKDPNATTNKEKHPAAKQRLLQTIAALPPTYSDLFIRPGTRVGGQVVPSGRIGGWGFAYDMRGIQPGVVTNYGAWYPLFYPYMTGNTFTYTPSPPPPVERPPYGTHTQYGDFKNAFQQSTGQYTPVQPVQLPQPAAPGPSDTYVPVNGGNDIPAEDVNLNSTISAQQRLLSAAQSAIDLSS